MNEEDYKNELGKIAEITKKKLYELQKNCNMEEIKNYREHLDFFWIFLLSSAVGEEAILHYMIELLNEVSKYQWNKGDLNKGQKERFEKIRREE